MCIYHVLVGEFVVWFWVITFLLLSYDFLGSLKIILGLLGMSPQEPIVSLKLGLGITDDDTNINPSEGKVFEISEHVDEFRDIKTHIKG